MNRLISVLMSLCSHTVLQNTFFSFLKIKQHKIEKKCYIITDWWSCSIWNIFINNSLIKYWKFEVVYRFSNEQWLDLFQYWCFKFDYSVDIDSTSLLTKISIYIRNTFDCITEENISSACFYDDLIEMFYFILSFQNSNIFFIQILSNGNQNLVGQISISISQQLDQMYREYRKKVLSTEYFL